MQNSTNTNPVSYFNFEYLKTSCQNFIDNVDIFSTNRYQNTTEMVINSLAYFGYVSILYALNSTVGRLALLGLAVYDISKGQYSSAILNFVLIGLSEVVAFCMALLGLYRAVMFAYDNSPEFKRHFNVIFPCAKSSSKEAVVEGQEAVVEGHEAVVEGQKAVVEGQKAVVEGQKAVVEGQKAVVEGQKAVVEGQKGWLDTPLNFMKKDFMRKKECVTDLCSKAYQLFTNKSTSSSTNENMNQASVLNR